MFRRGWRHYLATIGRIKPLYIWLFSILVWGSILASLGYQYLDRKIKEQHAGYHYQPARDEAHPARPLAGQPQAPQYNPACKAPVSRENSDLCAQWSAVEAVNEGNRLATINLWLTAIVWVTT